MPPSNVIQQASARAKVQEFEVLQGFKTGYRNREDVTVLPPGVLVQGSQNVLTNTSGRIGIRKGYTLDGQANTDLAPIASAFDWPRHTGDIKHLRAGFLTSAGNDGKLQFRSEVDENGDANVTWFDLLTAQASAAFNFANFWDFTTELKDLLLMVNGQRLVYEWSGATAGYASDAATTLTIGGSTTIGQLGFYQNGTRGFQIMDTGGTIRTFTYTGGEGTQTFTGVTPDPTAFTFAVDAPVWQTVRTTLNSAISSMPNAAPWTNDLIGVLRNQIYYGCLIQNSVYVSAVNNYKSVAFTSPVRVVGEGARLDLDGPPTAFDAQEQEMYLSAGKDYWYQTQFELSSDLAKETISVNRLKTTSNQSAMSQALTTQIGNSIVFLSNEPIIQVLGRVQNILADQAPQLSDISFPIVNDMDTYDWTNASLAYNKKYVYVAVPQEGLVLVYNMTDPDNPYWEAPQRMPISRFSIIDGEIYGHSSLVSESYQLFNGLNDNGGPIDARAIFSYNQHGVRSASKSLNKYYVEGYIAANTTLRLQIAYELDGCQTVVAHEIEGNNGRYVCLGVDANSLGKNALGKHPLGGDIATEAGADTLPPKFRVIRTFTRVPFYEQQTSFRSNGTDLQWELIAFGPNATPTTEGNNNITV